MKTPFILTAERIPVTYVEALLALAEEHGAARQALLDASGLHRGLPDDPERRVSFLAFHQLAQEALVRSGEPALGLLLGQRLNVSTHGILGYAVLASASLGDALQFAMKYYRVLGLMFELELQAQDGHLELRALDAFPTGLHSRFAAEGLLVSFLTIARFLLGEDGLALEAGFAYPAPEYADRYRAVFGQAPAFDQACHWLRIPLAYLERPMALANPATVQMCERQCEALLARLDVGDPLLTRVRRLLLARPGDFPDLDTAAAALHTSGRSLRRHLAELGTTYQQVLDDVRRRLALDYLTGTQLPLHEIAALLGFSDPSNFRRAFKKWTGQVPQAYRSGAAGRS